MTFSITTNMFEGMEAENPLAAAKELAAWLKSCSENICYEVTDSDGNRFMVDLNDDNVRPIASAPVKTMEEKDARYIVIGIDSKNGDNYGGVYKGLKQAKEEGADLLDKKLVDKVFCGMFVFDDRAEHMSVSQIHATGYKGKKRAEDLNLFT